MIFPTELFAQEALTPISLLGAVVLGAAFGFVLERSGFGRAQKLVAQFYLTDLSVFRVMFTAVVVAAVGTSLLAVVGLLDLKAVTVNYPTFLWPMIAGGLLVGAGFVVSGYCPGTSVVAAASGKLDGLLTVAGVVIGTVAYAEVEPAIAAFHDSGKLGGVFLYQLLHLSPLLTAALVAVLAVAGFVGAGAIERLVNGRRAPATGPTT